MKIEDTFAEAFEGLYCRIIVTADDEAVLCSAADDATATPAIVVGRVEGGVEDWISREKTPDGRIGAILQFWGGIDAKRPLGDSANRFGRELSYRIRQDILVKPFTAVFNALPHPVGTLDMMDTVGHCGDGFEWEERRHGRDVIIVPLMVPDFLIERHLGYARGIMGANFWYLCSSKKAVMEAGRKALQAINAIEGVVAPFGICSAGSKPETNFPAIGPTTNHPYCPSLKSNLDRASKVPDNVRYIPEIVLNGMSLPAVKAAMKAGIEAASSVNGVETVSAGNYGGKLGKYRIRLKELFP